MRSTTLIVGLLLSGYTLPVSAAQPVNSLRLPENYMDAPAASAAADISQWWSSLGDPILSDLIGQALANSPQIEIASAKVRQARASLVAARADILPSISANASGSRTDSLNVSSPAQSAYRVGIDASYEIDLFGRVSHSARAARASYRSSVSGLHDVQRLLAAETALDYVQLRNTQSRLAIAKANLGLQTETRDIVHWRMEAGLASSLDFEQAEAQLSQTAASIPALETSLAASKNRLATLVGQPAGALEEMLAKPAQLPTAPALTDGRVPSDLLSRRPDLIAAQSDFLASAERVGISKAALYPSLKLGGSITGAAVTPSGLFDNLLGSVFANFVAPIFNNGRLRANVRGAQAQADIAAANYRNAVLIAVEEAQNAYSQHTNATDRVAQLAKGESAAQNARKLANTQYQAGLIDFQKLLDSDRTLLSAQDNLASGQADQVISIIQLYKALGGGWQASSNGDQPAMRQ